MRKIPTAAAAFLLAAALTTACGANRSAEPSPPTPAPATTAPTPVAPASPSPADPSAGAPASPSPAGQGGQTAQAESVYKAANCLVCHGVDLGGVSAPNLQKVGSRYKEGDIKNIVLNGRGGMPAYKGKLSEDEIQSLAAWLAAKQ